MQVQVPDFAAYPSHLPESNQTDNNGDVESTSLAVVGLGIKLVLPEFAK